MDRVLKQVIAAVFIGVIASALEAPSGAQKPPPAAMQAAPQVTARTAIVTAPWSIAGVSLGMSPQAVGAALKAAGYALDYRYMGRSWEGEVANQVSNLRGIRIPEGPRVVGSEDYRKGQEFLQVTYAANRAGPNVSMVDYSISSNAIDFERFRAAVLRRYGRPSLKWDSESLYCSVGERQCARTGSLTTNQLPTLTVYLAWVMQRRLQLRQGERADKAYEAEVKAEAERLYPKKDRPTF